MDYDSCQSKVGDSGEPEDHCICRADKTQVLARDIVSAEKCTKSGVVEKYENYVANSHGTLITLTFISVLIVLFLEFYFLYRARPFAATISKMGYGGVKR